jgi:hypothetical protein
MPRISVDFASMDKPADEGIYLAEITGAMPKATKTDGSTMIAWEFTIIEPGANAGRKLTYFSNLRDQAKNPDGTPDTEASRKAVYFLSQFLSAVRCPFDEGSFTTEDALNHKALVKIEHEQYEGRTQARIKEVMPVVD